MENVEEPRVIEGGVADDLRGDGRVGSRASPTAAHPSDASDLTPALPEMIRRRISAEVVPLPQSVRAAAGWQAPSTNRLENSATILDTEEADHQGNVRLSYNGLNLDHYHFRSWQDDNGVAGTIASGTGVKDVDGVRRGVHATHQSPQPKRSCGRIDTPPAAASSASCPKPTTAGPLPFVSLLVGAHQRLQRRLSTVAEVIRESLRASEKDGRAAVAVGDADAAERVAGPSSPPTDRCDEQVPVPVGLSRDAVNEVEDGNGRIEEKRNAVGAIDTEPFDADEVSEETSDKCDEQMAPVSVGLSRDAVNESEDGNGRSEEKGNAVGNIDNEPIAADEISKETSSTVRSNWRTPTEVAPEMTDTSERLYGAMERGNAGPSRLSKSGSNQRFSPTPRPPLSGVASTHARQAQHGRSLSTQEVMNDSPAVVENGGGAEAIRRSSPASPSRSEGLPRRPRRDSVRVRPEPPQDQPQQSVRESELSAVVSSTVANRGAPRLKLIRSWSIFQRHHRSKSET